MVPSEAFALSLLSFPWSGEYAHRQLPNETRAECRESSPCLLARSCQVFRREDLVTEGHAIEPHSTIGGWSVGDRDHQLAAHLTDVHPLLHQCGRTHCDGRTGECRVIDRGSDREGALGGASLLSYLRLFW